MPIAPGQIQVVEDASSDQDDIKILGLSTPELCVRISFDLMLRF